MSVGENKTQFRILELDALRGLAALSVLSFHFLTQYDRLWGHSPDFWPDFPYGDYGVDLFFIISGFVILMTISKTKTAADFIVNRAARLYPVYWAAATLTFVVLGLSSVQINNARFSDYVLNLTMLNNAVNPLLPKDMRIVSVDGAYWSLQPELFFYALMMLPFYVSRLRHMERWILAWLMLSLLLTCLPENKAVKALGFLLNVRHADLFAAGMVFFLARKNDFTRAQAGLLSLCLVNRFLIDGPKGGTITAVFYGVFWLLHIGKVSWLQAKPLVFLGTISYSLYLFHQNVGYVLIKTFYNLNVSPWIGVPASAVIVIIAATMLCFAVERPANKGIRRIWTSWTQWKYSEAAQLKACAER